MIVIKIMEKRSTALNQGSCPSAASPFTSMQPATTSGSALWCTFPNIEHYSGEVRTGRRASPTARSRVDPNCMCLHDFCGVPQRTAFYGMRRGIPRSQSSFDLGSRQVREPSVFLKCPA
ncbi:hypothetical protein TcG_07138 [Trypanosoma cruzi]|nr:hypothetical protein TcG_07138 [Trypanosoma cruzi]